MNIEMPTSSASDLAGQVTSGLSTYASVIELFIGIVLAFFIIESIIKLFRKKSDVE